MKYVLILYVCSFLDVNKPHCTDSHVLDKEFNSYSKCILQGYISAHNTLKKLYSDRLEDEKLAIKFECKDITTNA